MPNLDLRELKRLTGVISDGRTYPIYKKARGFDLVVKFVALHQAVVVEPIPGFVMGELLSNCAAHTYDEVWGPDGTVDGDEFARAWESATEIHSI